MSYYAYDIMRLLGLTWIFYVFDPLQQSCLIDILQLPLR